MDAENKLLLTDIYMYKYLSPSSKWPSSFLRGPS